MLTRRQVLIGSAALACWPSGCARPLPESREVLLNDIHSQLNPTPVARVVRPASVGDLERVVRDARRDGQAISIAAGRHAMGGQQFGSGTVLVDMTTMNRVLGLDPGKGEIEVEAGIQWPALIAHLTRVQQGRNPQWTIIQKQTGADRLSIGGALSANVHGRGLRLRPFIGDLRIICGWQKG